jgi:hypothetical protein
VNLVTDGCSIGVAGCISQGEDWRTAPVVTFFSAKLSPAQQNYAVHEIEMLAGMETMVRNRHLLLGIRFRWFTDHKGLIYLLKQKDLTGRQARWLEKISEFDFEVVYVPGEQNILADALSRMYSEDKAGTVRAPGEYTTIDGSLSSLPAAIVSMPLLVGTEAIADQLSIWSLAAEPLPETGRPETSKEFSKRIKHVRLLMRSESGQEGGIPGDALGETPESPDAVSPKRAQIHLPIATGSESHDDAITQDHDDAITQSHDDAGSFETELSRTNEASAEMANGISADLQQQITQESLITGMVNPPLIDVVSYSDVGFDFPACLKGRYGEDNFFKAILQKPREFKNFVVKDELIFLGSNDGLVLCIPACTLNGRSVREVIVSHAHSILAHLGSQKTIAYLRNQVWWKDMNKDITKYCETCNVCKRSKPDNQKPFGLLNPLSVPAKPWESIGIDFVGPLPLSKNRDSEYDEIVMIIDRLTSMVHLVPGRQDYKARDMAELIFAEVYRLHGLPKSIVSDRDTLFTSAFWTHLHDLIGVELKMSSAYHPQTDGSTERANRTAIQMLRQCVRPDQKDWALKLPVIEFAINSARSETTGYAPFFLNSGRMPRSLIWNKPDANEYPGVRIFAQKMQNAVTAAHDSIIEARAKQTRSANRHRRPAPFVKGDLVYISTKNMSVAKGRARKLVPKYIGPYRILEDFGNSSFRIDLPANLKSRGLHNVFHASLLRIHAPNDDRLFPGRLDVQLDVLGGTEGEWLVDRIRSHTGQGANAWFEVLWKSGDVTWLPHLQITKTAALGEYLESQGVSNVRQLPRGSGKPPKDPELTISMLAHVLEQCISGYKGGEDEETHSPRATMASSISHNLKRGGPGFLLYDPEAENYTGHTVDQIRAYLKHDARLRTFQNGRQPQPDGYDRFADLYNEDILCITKLARQSIEESGRITVAITGPSPRIDFAPRSPTSPRGRRGSFKDDQRGGYYRRQLYQFLATEAEAEERRNDKHLQKQRHRRSLRSPDYSTEPGPSSSSRNKGKRRDLTDDRVPNRVEVEEDVPMSPEDGSVNGDSTIDTNNLPPNDDTLADDQVDYED